MKSRYWLTDEERSWMVAAWHAGAEIMAIAVGMGRSYWSTARTLNGQGLYRYNSNALDDRALLSRGRVAMPPKPKPKRKSYWDRVA